MLVDRTAEFFRYVGVDPPARDAVVARPPHWFVAEVRVVRTSVARLADEIVAERARRARNRWRDPCSGRDAESAAASFDRASIALVAEFRTVTDERRDLLAKMGDVNKDTWECYRGMLLCVVAAVEEVHTHMVDLRKTTYRTPVVLFEEETRVVEEPSRTTGVLKLREITSAPVGERETPMAVRPTAAELGVSDALMARRGDVLRYIQRDTADVVAIQRILSDIAKVQTAIAEELVVQLESIEHICYLGEMTVETIDKGNTELRAAEKRGSNNTKAHLMLAMSVCLLLTHWCGRSYV